jgi:ElaB/YqjD/DUF883 family membrane-anchored ribosome-binding protein
METYGDCVREDMLKDGDTVGRPDAFTKGQKADEKSKQGAHAVSDKVAHTVEDAYDKSTEMLDKAYERTQHYTEENPGKTILIAAGIGLVLGFILANNATNRYSRGGSYVRPIVSAVSGLAKEYFR